MSTDEPPDMSGRRRRRLGWGAGLLAAGTLGGAIIAGALPASAASSAPSSTSPSASSEQPAPGGSGGPAGKPSGQLSGQPDGQHPAGVGGQRSDEKLLTGTLAAQAKAAALKAVPGGTIIRVETDADGATYEAHMKKADGSLVTVKFDKNFAVTAVQAGMGSMKQPTTASGPA
jgi:hypothetical protein